MRCIVLSVSNSDANIYNDEMFVRYHFPNEYKSLIKEGDRFVYYFSDKNTNIKSYIGCGVVSELKKVDEKSYEAYLSNCFKYEPSIPFKFNTNKNDYIEMLGEVNPEKKLPAFQRAIRKLNIEAYFYIDNFSEVQKIPVYKNLPNDIDIPEFIEDYEEQITVEKAEAYTNKVSLEKSNNRKPLIVKYSYGRAIYFRDPMLVKTVLLENDYKCEISNDHITFESKNNHQYSEGHHLIPMKFQMKYLNINLDHVDNIFSLCPICHNAIHYGSDVERRRRLHILYNSEKFQGFLKKFEDIKSFNEFVENFY